LNRALASIIPGHSLTKIENHWIILRTLGCKKVRAEEFYLLAYNTSIIRVDE
jgi:hypothetical protein